MANAERVDFEKTGVQYGGEAWRVGKALSVGALFFGAGLRAAEWTLPRAYDFFTNETILKPVADTWNAYDPASDIAGWVARFLVAGVVGVAAGRFVDKYTKDKNGA